MIPTILNRFRCGKIGIISDIKRAFLQIALNKTDRDVLRFIWWEEGDPHKPVYYRHCTVLLATVLNVLDQAEEHIKTDTDDGEMTKRKILSIVHKIFNPIGFTCPATLLTKLLLQECWKRMISEDKGYDIVFGFEKWLNLDNLKEITIPRRLIPNLDTSSSIFLHVFCNAKELAKSHWWECPQWLGNPIKE
ncbi:integrase catalytic domain-containing protein [Trichonephila clavipes]|nr:integrase catalytic domain-containing protein [Trichonephila clavipes]